MAGLSKTKKFAFGTATVMIGDIGSSFSLNPDDHSLGLVKNFAMSRESNYVELGEGVRNDIVESVQNEENLTVSCEVYEFTPKNLAYAAGLDVSNVSPAGNVYAVASAPSGTSAEASVDPSSDVSANDWVVIQEGVSDQVHVAQVASLASNTLTLTAETAIPGGVTFTTAARIARAEMIGTRDSIFQPNYSVKVVGYYPDDARPITILFPKVKVTRGLDVNFNRDDFSNLPFEFTPYTLLPSDAEYASLGRKRYALFAS